MSEHERPGLPWLSERYGEESRAAALAARKAKHPNWNWGRFQKGGTTVHVHPGAPDHRIVRQPSVAIGRRGAFRVEQKDSNTPSGWRTVHTAEGLPGAQAHVEKKAGVADHSSMSVEDLRQRGLKASVPEKAAIGAELERRRQSVKQELGKTQPRESGARRTTRSSDLASGRATPDRLRQITAQSDTKREGARTDADRGRQKRAMAHAKALARGGASAGEIAKETGLSLGLSAKIRRNHRQLPRNPTTGAPRKRPSVEQAQAARKTRPVGGINW